MEKIFEWLLPIKKDDGMVLRGIRVGETAPIVRMHLIDDSGKGADITGVDAVSVVVERSDGMKVALTLSTQAVLCFCPAVVELSFADERLSAVAGLCVGVIDFYSGDIRMTSARFRYNVEPGIVVSDNEVAGDPEYSMFVGAMTDLAKLNEDVSEAENARNVFEVFDPYKEYVRGNKVAFGGASYVLIAESALGINPTDTGSWLCIAEAGRSVKTYGIGAGKYVPVGVEIIKRWMYQPSSPPYEEEIASLAEEYLVDQNPYSKLYVDDIFIDSDGALFKVIERDDFARRMVFKCIANPNGNSISSKALGGSRDIAVGEYLSNILIIPGIEPVFPYGDNNLVVDTDSGAIFITEVSVDDDGYGSIRYKCVANPNGKGVFSEDEYGNVTYDDNSVGCKAYYIKSIDLNGKKIYLSEEQVVPVISTADNTDTSFATPAYDVGDGFSIVNKNHYNNCGTIASVVNNVVTYSEDSLGFAAINEDTDGGIADYTFRVYNKPDIGVVAVTKYAFAVGSDNKALGSFSSAEGGGNVADGFYSHVEGLNNYAAYGAHAEGGGNMAIGNESHVEGHSTTALGGNSHAEGQNTIAKGGGSHAEGMGTQALGSQSHSEGLNTTASGAHSHAEGVNTRATVYVAHAEGNDTTASGQHSHAEGYKTIASGISSHAEGQETKATNSFAHAQGIRTYAEGYAAFASGSDVWASGDVSIAMGKNARATARASLAVGENVTASGEKSVALGFGTTAKQQGQVVVGMYNADDADAVFIVGNGTASARKNAFAVKKDGRIFAGGVELAGGGGFKKIGFSDDCDYIATSSDVLTAFNNAISEANDGDAIFIMPGTYTSAGTLTINKNINFIGVGMPSLNFVISIPCTTHINDNNEVVQGDTYTVRCQNIKFVRPVNVGIFTDMGFGDASTLICSNCCFKSPGSIAVSGSFYNCHFNIDGEIQTGSYYSVDSYFFNCNILCERFTQANAYVYGCDIHFYGSTFFGGGGEYFNSNIYIHTSGGSDICDHGYIAFYRCCFYGYEFEQSGNGIYTECYRIAGTAM